MCRVTGVSGDVRLENENGAVEVHMNKMGNMQVSNRNSDIQIYLPDKAAFQLDARSRGGEIESDFDALKIDNGDQQAIATGTVGAGGPHLVINNEHGGIELRKGSMVAEAPAPPQAAPRPRPAKGSGADGKLGPTCGDRIAEAIAELQNPDCRLTADLIFAYVVSHIMRPVGTPDNSPAFQRRVGRQERFPSRRDGRSAPAAFHACLRHALP